MTVEDGMLIFGSSKDFRESRHIHEQISSERFGTEIFLKMHT